MKNQFAIKKKYKGKSQNMSGKIGCFSIKMSDGASVKMKFKFSDGFNNIEELVGPKGIIVFVLLNRLFVAGKVKRVVGIHFFDVQKCLTNKKSVCLYSTNMEILPCHFFVGWKSAKNFY